jgi:hypothetical protein
MSDEPFIPVSHLLHEQVEGAVLCGARTRAGEVCQSPGMPNGRCRVHGGLSTGPRTPEGLERSRTARWQHGYYSAQAKRERVEARQVRASLRLLLAEALP